MSLRLFAFKQYFACPSSLSGFALLAISTLVLAPAAQSQESSKIDFNRQVKPILSDKCFACHGPDAAQRSTDLRLDTAEGATADLGGYAAIVGGDIEESELINRIFSEDDADKMPPADHRKSLTDTEKQILKSWIEQGANWAEHWAFVKPASVDSPEVQDKDWGNNWIDHFVLAKLEQEKIKPAPTAQDHTLLRRLSFDLTGLPPSREFTDKFSDNPSDPKAVEHLLNSSHFGERMAVYWLDLVRYADSVGYHGDQPVSVTPYRDYVINAFNDNMPFDQFTREQLAGDLLKDATQQQLIASGYNRLGMMSAEGGVQPEEYLAKYASDRVRTTASVWLGVTLGCAECHDHKFDPFSTKEFYEFASFFADIKEQGLYSGPDGPDKFGTNIKVPDPELAALRRPLDKKVAAIQAELSDTPEIVKERLEWEQKLKSTPPEWTSIHPESFAAANPIEDKIAEDNSILISGKHQDVNTYVVTATLPQEVANSMRAIRLEAIPHSSLKRNGPGRASNGNFVLTEFIMLRGHHLDEVDSLNKQWKNWPDAMKKQAIELQNASATVEQTVGAAAHPDRKWSAALAIDRDKNKRTWGWAILPDAGKPSHWVAQLAGNQNVTEEFTFVIQQHHGHGHHTIGNFRLSFTTAEEATSDPLHNLPENVRLALKIAPDSRDDKQQQAVTDYYISIAPRFKEINRRLADVMASRKGLVDARTRTSLVTSTVSPREMRVLARGNWMDKTGEVVSPGVPAIIAQPNWTTNQPTRLELAAWITDKDNPLTARVYVNRLWRMFFGSGLSNVLDDFGSQGEPPSHPELLDRLAVEFVDSGWDVKHMVRLMVTSKAYQQNSALRSDLADVDPENRWIARQSRYRLDAEFIRDHALAVSGLLSEKVGGRNAKPYQPVGMYRHLNFPKRKYEPTMNGDQYRRGLYTHWQRQYLHPAMKTFDAPAREECTAARPRSSTPLAALLLLNDPSYVEAAKAFAEEAFRAHESDGEKRINWIFQRAFSRNATEQETEIISKLIQSQLNHYETNPAEAKKLISIGLPPVGGKPNPHATVAELAAWTSACRAVINMHEFVLRK